MKNNKQFTAREEKLAYLKGLKEGTRSLTEITKPPVIFLTSRDDRPGIVVIELTGKVMTEEEADVISKKKNKDTIIFELKKTYLDKAGSLADNES